ncbi:MAG: hypothetical protein IJE98_06165 [Oscillospiraceae bacterium]|nr:hypothetical protein [Oscillospiraceae bacterium]
MNPWREKVLAFNRDVAEKGEKASDLEQMIAAMAQLPPGQLKKVLTEDVMIILAKYGIE